MKHVNVLITSLLITILLFTVGILINYGMDFVRIESIVDVMSAHELSRDAYFIETEFTELFGGNRCKIMQERIIGLKYEIQQVGADLSSYSSFSFFKKKDFDYLKRKYFLLELRFLALVHQINKDCGNPYVPIVFFYEIDNDPSERQGFILDELSKHFKKQVVVLSLDKDYKDEPLVELLTKKYNVTSAPTLIINEQKFEGLKYKKELKSIINEILEQ